MKKILWVDDNPGIIIQNLSRYISSNSINNILNSTKFVYDLEEGKSEIPNYENIILDADFPKQTKKMRKEYVDKYIKDVLLGNRKYDDFKINEDFQRNNFLNLLKDSENKNICIYSNSNVAAYYSYEQTLPFFTKRDDLTSLIKNIKRDIKLEAYKNRLKPQMRKDWKFGTTKHLSDEIIKLIT